MSEPTPTEIMEAIKAIATAQAETVATLAKLGDDVKHMRSALEIRIDTLSGEVSRIAAEFVALRLDLQSERGEDMATANASFAEAVHSLTKANAALSRRVAALEAKG